MTSNISADPGRLAEFCQRWNVAELSIFGSALRSDFGPGSDIDLLVRFRPGDRHTLFHIVQMQQELESIFGRPVDLVERAAVEQSDNFIRRRHILENAQPLYVA